MWKWGSELAAHPSARRDGLSCDVGGLVRAQKGHYASDFLHLSDPEGWKPLHCIHKCNRDNSSVNILNLSPHLLMLSCFLNSSTMASFSHSWWDKQKWDLEATPRLIRTGLRCFCSLRHWSGSWWFQGPRSWPWRCSGPAREPEPWSDPAGRSCSRSRGQVPAETHTSPFHLNVYMEINECTDTHLHGLIRPHRRHKYDISPSERVDTSVHIKAMFLKLLQTKNHLTHKWALTDHLTQ